MYRSDLSLIAVNVIDETDCDLQINFFWYGLGGLGHNKIFQNGAPITELRKMRNTTVDKNETYEWHCERREMPTVDKNETYDITV